MWLQVLFKSTKMQKKKKKKKKKSRQKTNMQEINFWPIALLTQVSVDALSIKFRISELGRKGGGGEGDYIVYPSQKLVFVTPLTSFVGSLWNDATK